MGIAEALKERKSKVKASCEYCIEAAIREGKFYVMMNSVTVEDMKVYIECFKEINDEMKGTGYHIVLDYEAESTSIDVYIVRDGEDEKEQIRSLAAKK